MLIKDILTSTEPTHSDFQKLATAYNNVKILDEQLRSIKSKQEAIRKLTVTLQPIQETPVFSFFLFSFFLFSFFFFSFLHKY